MHASGRGDYRSGWTKRRKISSGVAHFAPCSCPFRWGGLTSAVGLGAPCPPTGHPTECHTECQPPPLELALCGKDRENPSISLRSGRKRRETARIILLAREPRDANPPATSSPPPLWLARRRKYRHGNIMGIGGKDLPISGPHFHVTLVITHSYGWQAQRPQAQWRWLPISLPRQTLTNGLGAPGPPLHWGVAALELSGIRALWGPGVLRPPRRAEPRSDSSAQRQPAAHARALTGREGIVDMSHRIARRTSSLQVSGVTGTGTPVRCLPPTKGWHY